MFVADSLCHEQRSVEETKRLFEPLEKGKRLLGEEGV